MAQIATPSPSACGSGAVGRSLGSPGLQRAISRLESVNKWSRPAPAAPADFGSSVISGRLLAQLSLTVNPTASRMKVSMTESTKGTNPQRDQISRVRACPISNQELNITLTDRHNPCLLGAAVVQNYPRIRPSGRFSADALNLNWPAPSRNDTSQFCVHVVTKGVRSPRGVSYTGAVFRLTDSV